jgi:predicted membrane-bound spermidine synthase
MATLGGAAALSWEVVWQLQASLAFGISAVGAALTLAATMGGMAVGATWAGAWLRGRRIARPLRLYGWLELAIGVAGALMLPGFEWLEALDARVFAVAPALAPVLHMLGMTLLLAPATCAMGATLPVFQLVCAGHGTRISILYGMNTAGAAIGVLLLTFELLPALGVARSCALAVGVNLTVFVLAMLLPAQRAGAASGPQEAAVPPAPEIPAWVALVAFVTGFATFGLEVAWFRAMRSAFWSTSATFAIVLASVLVPLALGARLVPLLLRRGIGPAITLSGAGVAILLSTPLVERFDLVATVEGSWEAVMISWFLLSLIVVGPAVCLLATALPWFLESHPEPRASGRLYALNTTGSVAGSLLAAWVLLPVLGFARTAWALGLLVLGVALVRAGPGMRVAGAAIGALALGLAVVAASSPGRDRLHGRRSFDQGRVLALDEGPDFTTSVIETGAGFRSLLIDGFTATSENPIGAHYMAWMGRLPALLHPDPERSLVICFGTGQTANGLREEGVARLDVVDVSRAVLGMAGYFPRNEGVLDDPRVRAIPMDGRAWLRRTTQEYDVVTLEPMPPNFAGVNSLYSREFYEIVASRLSRDGIVAQWLPIHLVTPAHSEAIVATFHAVFPDAILWIDPIGGTGILLGRRVPVAGRALGADWPGLVRKNTGRTLTQDEIRRAVLLEPEALARYARLGTVISDDNQLLAHGRARPGLQGRLGQQLARTNLQKISGIAGRRPYLLKQSERLERVRGPGS